ncbi:MAG: Serine hydroxymethyltransferase [Phycisphaerae bacterium]|nr:Serine hydroxymethyltransferase [Phycisphaerae bacterium]
MFERFTNRARQVMILANQEAKRLNHVITDTEHLLLGLIREGSGVGAYVLKNLSVDLSKLRSDVEQLIKCGNQQVVVVKLPLTTLVKSVIKTSVDEARGFNHNYVGTEHLLLGLLTYKEGIAGQVLADWGLNLEIVRERIVDVLSRDDTSIRENTGSTMKATYDLIAQQDAQVAELFQAETDRQQNTIELIASENHVSPTVLQALGSIFTNKYAEGYPGKRYYGGCVNMDGVEELARNRAKQLFGCDHVNVQPHSGSQANQCVYLAMLKPGDTILSLDLAHGGHLSHGMKINMTGLLYNIVHYGVSPKDFRFDLAEVRRLAREHKPKLILTGASAYPRTIDFAAFSEIAHEVGAYHMADIAHIAGLVATGLHPSPVPVAEFVTTTTHKTLRGPRGGMTMCKADHAKVIDTRVFPGLQGGPLMHVIAAKAVAFGEALRPEFKYYQQQILKNAQALCDGLKSAGINIVSGGTDNHLMLVDLRPSHPKVTGKDAEQWLEAAGIITNKNMIPFDERKPIETSGLRLGTPAVTTRGFKEPQMKTIAGWIGQILSSNGDTAIIQRIRNEVLNMCKDFPLP